MLINPGIEMQIDSTWRGAWQDVRAAVLLELTVQDAIAAVSLLFVALQCILIFAGMVVLEPIDLAYGSISMETGSA